MNLRVVVIALRLIMGALAIAGAVTQFVLTIVTDFGIVNFFSYFTTLSNLFGGTVFIVGAILLWRGRGTGEVAPAVRGAAVVYLAFVGIVFNTLLVDADVGDLQPWVNLVHHMLMPLAVVVDWVLAPPRSRIGRRAIAWWMAVIAAYVVYSLVRGAITGFYAYPFFNPSAVGGYGGVALYCAGMLIAFVLLAFLVRWSGNSLVARHTRTR